MYFKVKTVTTLPDYILLVEFQNKQIKHYDVKQLFDKYEEFNALKAEQLFQCVKVDTGGYGISWNDDLDISCDEIWEHGKISN